MRTDIFDEIAPVCPRCLHLSQAEHPLAIAEQGEMRAGQLWHGILHCTNTECWQEYPVIDGVPVITPDPSDFLTRAQHQILRRPTLPGALDGLLGDALGQGSEFDRDRQHISLYAGSQFADWADAPSTDAPFANVVERALAMADLGTGPAVDLGCGVGRAAWEIAAQGRTVLGLDLNFTMLRLAQQLRLDGHATFQRRRIGLVYDPVDITLPAMLADAKVDFWAADCLALPFRAASFGFAAAINVVDCIAAPTNMLVEAARILAPAAGALFTTPYDWSETATEKAGWMGGHSGRAPHRGAAEPVLTATLKQAGFRITSEDENVAWLLQMHARSVMHYSLHMIACQKSQGSQ